MRRWRVPPGSVAFTPGCVASAAHTQAPASTTGSDGAAGAVSGPASPGVDGAVHTGGVRVRVDSGVDEGDDVGTFYDPMIAKLVVWGPDRCGEPHILFFMHEQHVMFPHHTTAAELGVLLLKATTTCMWDVV